MSIDTDPSANLALVLENCRLKGIEVLAVIPRPFGYVVVTYQP